MKEIELKPCPFCGGQGKLKVGSECGGFGCNTTLVYVECEQCGARGETADSYFHDGNEAVLKMIAILGWNRRADNAD